MEFLVASPTPATPATPATSSSSAPTALIVAASLLAIRRFLANLHVLRERKYAVNTLAEAEIISRSINSTNKETTALPHRVVADLKRFNARSDLLIGLSAWPFFSKSSNTICSYVCQSVNLLRQLCYQPQTFSCTFKYHI